MIFQLQIGRDSFLIQSHNQTNYSDLPLHSESFVSDNFL